MKYGKRKLLTAGLSMVLIAAQGVSVSADTDDDIAAVQAQQEQTNADLSAVQGSISEMETQKQAIMDQIDGYDQELVVTIASIKSLEDQVSQKEKELEQTGRDLEEAEKDQDTQYAAMKKRIQYLYEEGGTGGWAGIILGETSLSVGMNQVDDTQSLYKYDREELASYTEAVKKVTDLQEQETEQKASLETMKQEQEDAQQNLELLKQSAEAESDDYAARISEAETVADQYYALIQEQNDQISQLQAKKAAEEEAARKAAEEEAARKAAEEEAARKAAEEEAARQAAAAAAAEDTGSGSTSSDAGTGSSGQSGSTSYTGEQAAQQEATQAAISSGEVTTVNTSTEAGSNAAASSDSSLGSSIASYACQFVGNPYVWGGTSLTNGCDCSGFVQSVFAHFGISLSRTTYTQANEGVAVSYDQMQPGDVINYGFHTAIYIGNNQIVHAANERLGIIIQSNPAFQPITTIRRFY